MPRFADLKAPPEEVRKHMRPVTPPNVEPAPPRFQWHEGINPFLRCSLPVIKPVSPDSLRQFYREGTAQTRMVSP